jgi:hypothetical protein
VTAFAKLEIGDSEWANPATSIFSQKEEGLFQDGEQEHVDDEDCARAQS